MLTARIVSGIFPVAMMVLGAGVVSGQDYPNKPIRIVTSAVGGIDDFTARSVAQGISGPLGQQVIVDNRQSNLAGEIASKASPDGYTLLGGATTFWLGPLLSKTAYDPVSDFTPISLVSLVPNVLVVHPSLPVKSVRELIALAKARPGELNYSAGGAGGSPHLAAELFKVMASVNIVRINYKGGSSAVTGLIGGEVQLSFPTAASVAPHLKSGRLRALAVTTAEPSALVPGLPTLAAMLPGFESAGRSAVFAPAKTPEAIIRRLNEEIVRFLKTAEAKERFFNSGVQIVGSSPGELAATMKSEMTKWGKLITDAGIRAD